MLATVAVCLPSFILVLLISYFFAQCKDNKYIKAAMSGLLPMSVALIASAALFMMNREYFMDYKSIGIFEAAFWGTWKWNLYPILLICLAGVVGCCCISNACHICRKNRIPVKHSVSPGFLL